MTEITNKTKAFINLVKDVQSELVPIRGNERNAYNLIHDKSDTSREAYVFFEDNDTKTIEHRLVSPVCAHKHESKYCIEYYKLQYLIAIHAASNHNLLSDDLSIYSMVSIK